MKYEFANPFGVLREFSVIERTIRLGRQRGQRIESRSLLSTPKMTVTQPDARSFARRSHLPTKLREGPQIYYSGWFDWNGDWRVYLNAHILAWRASVSCRMLAEDRQFAFDASASLSER